LTVSFFAPSFSSQIIREANAQYYGSSTDGSSLSDAEFDLLYQELQGLEEAYPALLHKDSPTQRPGAAPAPATAAKKGRSRAKKKDKSAASAEGEMLLESAAPVAHRLPMLSLDSTTSFDKLRAWDASLRKKLAALQRKGATDDDASASAASAAVPAAMPYTLELKYDGIAVSLLYRRVPIVVAAAAEEEGEFDLKLERVLTRGTGAVGEDISRAVARWGRGVPSRLDAAWLSSQPNLARLIEAPDAVVEVRGEMMLSKSAQKDYADFLRRHGGDGENAAAQAETAASTPARNLASGLLRRDIGAAVSGIEEVLDDQGRPAPACLDLVAYSLHFHHPDVLHVTDYLQPPPGKRSSSSAEKRSVVPATQGEALSMLKHLGMPTSMPQSSSAAMSSSSAELEAENGSAAAAVRRQFATAHECASIEAVISELEQLSLRRDSLDFAIDGAVVKLADLRLARLLGVTSHHPKAMLAFKWAPKMATTTLRGIEWAVGRTPKLTPVALLEPVLLDGVRVGRANMHNASVVADMLPLRVGERVLIERRGDAIPHIVGKAPSLPSVAAGASAAAAAAAPQEHDDTGAALELPSQCPACGSDLVLRASASDASRSDLLCSAPSERPCVGQVAAQMEYYASRGVMDLAGLGEASLAALREAGFLERGVADIVRLPSRRAELMQAAEDKLIPKFTSNRVDKLLDVIEERHRSASDVQFLLALGIARLGPAQAKALVNVVGSASAVLAADRDTLEATPVPGVGTKLLADFAEALEDARSGKRSELVQAWREAGYLDDKPRQTGEQQSRTKRASSNANDETKTTRVTAAAAARTEAREAKEAAKEAARASKAQQREAKLAAQNAARAAKLEAKAAREADKTTSRKKRAPSKPRAARPEGDEEKAEAIQEDEALLSPTASQPLRGMRVCILGRLASAKRADVVQAVKSLGGVVQVVCSRSTTHLLQGSASAAASIKVKEGDEARQQALLSARSEAMERGVPLLDEAAFHVLLSDAANKAAEADLEADKEAALEAARDEEK
jgi:DNA ligase (NAD+)